jgi:hypothetical protein
MIKDLLSESQAGEDKCDYMMLFLSNLSAFYQHFICKSLKHYLYIWNVLGKADNIFNTCILQALLTAKRYSG